MNKAYILKLLKDKRFIRSIKKDLLNDFNHEIVQKPRLYCGPNDYQGFQFKRDSFLTGGAVCSLILEKLYGIKRVINDIDIFYYQLNLKEDVDEYGMLEEGKGYHIGGSKEFGKLNLIKIHRRVEFNWQYLLKSFDLNYAQVGISLYDDELIFTDNFVDFLESKEIKLIDHPKDCTTILTTVIRAITKAKELNLTFYSKDVMRLYLFYNSEFADCLKITSSKRNSEEASDEDILQHNLIENSFDGPVIEIVTKKRLEVWKNDPNLIPFLKLTSDTAVDIIWPNEPWDCFMRGLMSKRQSLPSNYLEYFPKIFLKKSEYNKIGYWLDSGIFSSPLNGHDSFFFKKYLNYQINEVDLEKIKNFMNAHSLFHDIFLFIAKYSDANILSSIVNTYVALSSWELKEIGYFENIILNNHEGLRANRSSSGVFKNWNYLNSSNSKNETPTKLLNFSIDCLTTSLEKHKKSIAKKIQDDLAKDVLAIPLKLTPYSPWVRELTLASELSKEGKLMNHCVGGYTNAIKSGRSKIFHIDFKGKTSTLEIEVFKESSETVESVVHLKLARLGNCPKFKKWMSSLDLPFEKRRDLAIKIKSKIYKKNENNNPVFKLKQHKSRFNNTPDKINQVIAQKLIQYLNNSNTYSTQTIASLSKR